MNFNSCHRSSIRPFPNVLPLLLTVMSRLPPPPGMPAPPPGMPPPSTPGASTSQLSAEVLAQKSHKWVQMQNKRYNEKRRVGFIDTGKQVSLVFCLCYAVALFLLALRIHLQRASDFASASYSGHLHIPRTTYLARMLWIIHNPDCRLYIVAIEPSARAASSYEFTLADSDASAPRSFACVSPHVFLDHYPHMHCDEA